MMMPDWLLQLLIVCSANIVSGFIIWVLTHFHNQNKKRLNRIETKVDHTHDCVEETKERISFIEGRLGIGRHVDAYSGAQRPG